MGTELFHADRQTDRQTDMTMLIVAFISFAKAPVNKLLSPQAHKKDVLPVDTKFVCTTT